MSVAGARGIFALAVLTAAPGLAQTQAANTPVGFSPDEVAWANGPGTTTVEGTLNFKYSDGNWYECTDAFLIPYSKYDEALFQYFNGSDLSQVDKFGLRGNKKFPKWARLDKQSDKAWLSRKQWQEYCTDGHVKFTAVPAGTYFLNVRYIIGKDTLYTGLPGGLSLTNRGFNTVKKLVVPATGTLKIDTE